MAFIAILQLVYVIVGVHRRKMYEQSSAANKARILNQYIYQLLKVKGIEATLGWKTRIKTAFTAYKIQ